MRPRHLWMQGLRSYRQPAEVDFTKDGLLAIVGDTGAGKSSILEAITYALYNATTWDQRNVKALISDGMQTMVVELAFEADGHTYRIRRSTSRGASPPPVHLLTCEDDPQFRVDGEAQIAAEVRRLVGLDYAGFKAAVVLPQGQFDQLLHATPGQRTDLLKGIFRLEDLDRVRLAVSEARNVAQELWFALRSERSQLRENPAADFAQAEADAARHGRRVTALTAVGEAVRSHAEAERGLVAEGERLRAVAELVAKANLSQSTVLQALGKVDAEIAKQIVALTGERAGWEERHRVAVDQLAAAEREGRSMSALNRVCTCLERARQCEREAGTRRGELEEWHRRLASASDRAGILARSVPDLEARAAEQAKLAGAAREACESAQRNLQEYESQVRQAREEARRLDAELERRHRLHEEWSRRRDRELPALERAHAQAEVQVHEAEALLDTLQRDHAAHVAAVGLGAGDPCPVCE
ncbi:MAG: SMC family ATPase, partial [Candidatus Dormibacteraeota bacterium]|nr:SMC family ATPase [Candidatus Dormibacteraeota bacterium]